MNLSKLIPNFVTSMNLVCGLIGVVFAFDCRYDLAFYMMLAAAVFDFLDGFVARAMKAASDFGKELDSLCDVVSFGVLPALILYRFMSENGHGLLAFVPLLLAVFSVLRLAKFNTDPRQSGSFIGLATPASALLCGALACFSFMTPDSGLAGWMSGPVFIPVLTLLLCVLLVCELPMFAFKFHRTDPSVLNVERGLTVLVALLALVACIALSLHWSVVAVVVILFYVLENLIVSLFKIA